MAGLLSDIRSAWRLMGRYRSTSVLILVTLALGLGANVAIFAIAQGVVLRPLPYADPDRLVMIWGGREPRQPGDTGRGLATPRWFHEITARQRSFSAIAAVESWNGNPSATFDLPSATGAERLRGAFATPNFFTTIGVTAARGRTFTPDDPPDVAVISDDLWRSLFGRTDVVGRRLELATGRGKARAFRPVTIVGVLPPGVQFSYPERTDVWLPLTRQQLENPGLQDAILYRLIARLKADTTLEQAHQDMAAVKMAMAAAVKRDYSGTTWWLEPVHENAVAESRPAVTLLSGIALLVFFVACLNVATLLLAQTVERRRAFAVQVALGASRWRLIRQLLTESALMSMMAAVVSLGAVAALQPLLRNAIPASIPRIEQIGIDLVTVAWLTVLVALAVILATVVPAWRSSALDPGVELAQSSRSSTQSRAAALWRQSLMAAQVAIVVVQLVSGGLLLHSFWRLQQVDLGFDGDRVFAAEMRLLDPKYFDTAKLQAFQEALLTRVRVLPGVERASITSSVPLRGVDWSRAIRTDTGIQMVARERDVDPDYFDVMGIPLLAGRGFTAADAGSAAPVAIVSWALADRLFGGETAVGQRLPLNPTRQPEIVGIVGDVRNVSIGAEGDPAYYVPRAQQSTEVICLVVRMAEDAPDLAPAVRAIVASIDPMQPVFNATTVDRIVSETIADRRFFAIATVAFAVVTLLLAAAGLYGVTSYTINARTCEIGIRAALGAEPGRLIRLLTLQSLRPVGMGVVFGLVAALGASRLIEQFLYDVHAFDPLTYASVVTAILTFTIVATAWPATYAARVNPTVALRHD